jgi:aldose sugar dehydrogenase
MKRYQLVALATTLPLALAPGPDADLLGQPAPQTVSSSIGELRVERIATLEYPWGMTPLPDGRVLITEKPGRLRIWDGNALSEPVQGVPEVVYRGPGDQGGLLDVEIDPGFESNGLVYLSYVEAAEEQPEGVEQTDDPRFGGFLDTSDDVVRGGAVARGRLEGHRLDDIEVIWRQEPKTVGRGHFGHRLLFSDDGTLFITSGERMRFDPAQSLEANLGKIVRIHPDGSIPRDNPFTGEQSARGDIWSYGHRNVLAAAIDPASGELWSFEMGPLGGDEVNLVRAGTNYGWPEVSNGSHYDGETIPPHAATEEFQAPVRTWTPVVSPSGAAFYDGDLFPQWRGSAFIGGLSSQALVRLVLDGERVALEERIDMQRRIRDVMQAPDGALLLIVDAREGELLRITPGGSS